MKTNAIAKAVSLMLLLVFPQNGARAQPISGIAVGRFHSLFIKGDGSLWATGENPVGQLGDGSFIVNSPYGTNLPVRSLATNVTSVSAGNHHTVFTKGDHSLWGMGENSKGQLGIARLAGSPSVIGTGINPPELLISGGVRAVVAGESHTLLVKDEGSLWAMGLNRNGQLGDGTTNDSMAPLQIVASGVTMAAANYQQSFFLKNDGSLWAMGDNGFGKLGLGASGSFRYTNTPTQVIASNVVAVAAGEDHTLLLKTDGSLWGMGNNGQKQLGDGVGGILNAPTVIVTNGVKAIAAGFSHSVFLRTDGSLWGMGNNSNGELGDGTFTQVNHPKQLIASGVIAIATLNVHTLFLKEDGSLWGMGSNTHGELGNGTFTNANHPVLILAGYNRISVPSMEGSKLKFSFVGVANMNYALERSDSLAPSSWIPQETNSANSFGSLSFTNTPSAASNNFWRVRSLPCE